MTIDLQQQDISVQEFIQTIKGNKGPYCIRTLSDSPDHKYGKQNYRQNWTFRDEGDLQRAIRGGLVTANLGGNGVFLVVNNGAHCDDSITEVTAHFIDFDHVPMNRQLELLETFGLAPSVVTLPRRGLHVYWRVKDGDITKFRMIQERLINFFGSDPTIKNESRLMRLPGYYHQKTDPKMVEVVYWHPENVYRQDELIQRLDELGVPQLTKQHKKKGNFGSSRKSYVAPIGIVDQELLALLEGHVGNMTTTDGEQYQCLCPMHDDHNPSGVYFAGNEWFYCHACQTNLALSELAAENNWINIKKYREKRSVSERKKAQAQYESKVQQALSVPYSMPEYVYGKSKVEVIETHKTIHDVLNTFVSEMEQRGLSVPDGAQESAKQIIKLWDRLENPNDPIVWPAQPGSGKSTLRNLYVDIKCNIEPTFGCILVVERKEDAEEIAKFLNRFEKVAWSYLGWDESWCLAGKSEYESDMCHKCERSSCRVLRNHAEQLRHRVVITTHQRFSNLARRGALGSTLGHWIDTDGERHDRRLLIIDEAPSMANSYTVTRKDLQELKTTVQQHTAQFPSLENEWLSLYNDAIRFLDDVTNTRFVTENDIKIQIPRRLEKALGDLPEHTWHILLRFLEHGGIVHEDRDDGFTVTVANSVAYKWDNLCPFILDATGAKDLRYDGEYSCLPEVTDSYPPISLHVCSDFGFGKRYMSRNTDRKVLEVQASVAQTLAAKHDKVLVIVRKDYESDYHRLLAKELSNNKIQIAHFGDLKGRNDYQDCDASLFLGVLDKGDEYYLATATARDEDARRLCLSTAEYGKVHRFLSVEIERFKLNEIALELTQDIYRTQVRRGKPVDVYVFSRDEMLMKHVARTIGIPEVDLAWKPTEVIPLTKAEKHVSRLIGALTHFLESGNSSIDKSELKIQLGIEKTNDKVWRRLMKNDYVQAFCMEHGITEECSNSRRLILSERPTEAEVSQLA
ncbi:hypothetical protein [Alicyclobacillus sp. SO9]|uniref:hypothetical protein n=1 Tax=Alicyclobacillus sp. SO9 TaxID=2665646 RepID=UPI0018E78905|nr:hypothetical protein [Alicyclobacillus sp. SO9]QQE80394.1 hypothetical protein GI364_08245 [Alicyclobacillus sp. SO9]